MRDERLADQVLDQSWNSRLVLRNFDATGFASTACMDLRLDDKDWGIEFCRPGRSCLGRSNLFPARNRNPELPKQLLTKELMNVHVFLPRDERDSRERREG